MNEMSQYKQKVKLAAALRNGQPIYNGSAEHAAVLSAAIFEHSKKTVDILSGSLDAAVYGNSEVIEKARSFISVPERKVRILVEDPEKMDLNDHPFIREFSDSDDVTIKVVDDSFDFEYHFTVADGDTYRFEKQKESVAAVAAFGDEAGAGRLDGIFATLWDNSTQEVKMPQHH